MQQEVSAVCEGYRAKTNPWIVMVSTPYKPGDVFESRYWQFVYRINFTTCRRVR
jgi:hypothetical protein